MAHALGLEIFKAFWYISLVVVRQVDGGQWALRCENLEVLSYLPCLHSNHLLSKFRRNVRRKSLAWGHFDLDQGLSKLISAILFQYEYVVRNFTKGVGQ